MRKLIVILFLITVGWGGFAQSDEAMKKLESAKIGLITERLDLTPEQAEKFWPIYREFAQQRNELRNEFREARRDMDPTEASEEENERLVKLHLRLKEREVDLEKEYSEKLLRVINSRQLISLRRAEDDFRKMILRRIEQRRRMQDRREEMRQRDQNLRNQRRNN